MEPLRNGLRGGGLTEPNRFPKDPSRCVSWRPRRTRHNQSRICHARSARENMSGSALRCRRRLLTQENEIGFDSRPPPGALASFFNKTTCLFLSLPGLPPPLRQEQVALLPTVVF